MSPADLDAVSDRVTAAVTARCGTSHREPRWHVAEMNGRLYATSPYAVGTRTVWGADEESLTDRAADAEKFAARAMNGTGRHAA